MVFNGAGPPCRSSTIHNCLPRIFQTLFCSRMAVPSGRARYPKVPLFPSLAPMPIWLFVPPIIVGTFFSCGYCPPYPLRSLCFSRCAGFLFLNSLAAPFLVVLFRGRFSVLFVLFSPQPIPLFLLFFPLFFFSWFSSALFVFPPAYMCVFFPPRLPVFWGVLFRPFPFCLLWRV